MKEAIQVSNLSFSYGSISILNNVSFSVYDGEYVSVIGPNGAGKSTLVKCIDRILTGWTGDILMFGNDIKKLSQRELARFVAYVPQAGERSIPYTVEEFVLMGRYSHMSPFTLINKEDRMLANNALEITGITSFADRYIDSLSGGERQIVFIAAALAQGAKILILDEPTAFLDYKHQVRCSELLEKLNCEQGITLLSVTHDINQAAVHGNRIIALKDGEVFFIGIPEELSSGCILEDLYGTQFTTYLSGSKQPILMPCGGAS